MENKVQFVLSVDVINSDGLSSVGIDAQEIIDSMVPEMKARADKIKNRGHPVYEKQFKFEAPEGWDAEMSDLPVTSSERQEIIDYKRNNNAGSDIGLTLLANFRASDGRFSNGAHNAAALARFVNNLEVKPEKIVIFSCNIAADKLATYLFEFANALTGEPKPDIAGHTFIPKVKLDEPARGSTLYQTHHTQPPVLKEELSDRRFEERKKYLIYNRDTRKHRLGSEQEWSKKEVISKTSGRRLGKGL